VRAIHHLESAELTAAENEKLYGKCYRTHGHHYHIQVTIAGSVDPVTGLVVSRDAFQALLQREVVDRYDARDLNKLFPVTSCEALAVRLHAELAPQITSTQLGYALGATWSNIELVRISIRETKKNYFESLPASAPATSL
jgi:6-pyruvoyltetrahydropterin/6-carboxytetrahydropterin synthase